MARARAASLASVYFACAMFHKNFSRASGKQDRDVVFLEKTAQPKHLRIGKKYKGLLRYLNHHYPVGRRGWRILPSHHTSHARSSRHSTSR